MFKIIRLNTGYFSLTLVIVFLLTSSIASLSILSFLTNSLKNSRRLILGYDALGLEAALTMALGDETICQESLSSLSNTSGSVPGTKFSLDVGKLLIPVLPGGVKSPYLEKGKRFDRFTVDRMVLLGIAKKSTGPNDFYLTEFRIQLKDASKILTETKYAHVYLYLGYSLGGGTTINRCFSTQITKECSGNIYSGTCKTIEERACELLVSDDGSNFKYNPDQRKCEVIVGA